MLDQVARVRAMSDYKPLTVVDDDTYCPTEVLVERIKKSREENGDLLQRYHDLWYECGHTWHYTHFLGVGMMKSPNDIWMYQDLMTRLRPQVVIEMGTYQGGSALWFAFLMDMLRIDGGRVLTVDIKDYRKTWLVQHPRITFLDGNSANPAVRDSIVRNIKHVALRCEKCGNVAAATEDGPDGEGDICPVMHCDGRLYVRQELIGPTLVVLDSDHSAEHVRNELELYAPLLRVGDWLVVEDTNIGWTDNREHLTTSYFDEDLWHFSCSCGHVWEVPAGGSMACPQSGDRGARGGVQDYMDKHPGEFVQDLLSERYLLTMNPGGWMQRVKGCEHV
jgi:cephalosporin hydroxylase